MVSYNDESWINPEEMTRALREAGRACVEVVAFDSKRYVGAQIGVHGPTGEKVGEVKRLRNVEYLFLAGDADRVDSGFRLRSRPVDALRLTRIRAKRNSLRTRHLDDETMEPYDCAGCGPGADRRARAPGRVGASRRGRARCCRLLRAGDPRPHHHP